MPVPMTLAIVSLSVLLGACSEQAPAPNVDPLLGRACFQQQLNALPPGSQYEGIASADAKSIRIKVMNGVDVVSVECALGADGQLASPSE